MPTKNIIRPVEIGLRFTGIWPSAYENFFRLLWVLMMSPTLVIQYWYVRNRFNSENLVDLIECVSCAVPYALIFLKLVTFWNKRRVFKTILIAMDADWDNTSITKDLMAEKVKLSTRCSQLVLSIYVFAVFTYSLVYINGIRSTGYNNISAESAELLIKMELPSVAYESLNFQYVIIAQICQLLLVAFAIATMDSLLITLILHVGGQIEVIHQVLAGIQLKGIKRGLQKSTFKYLFKKHQNIIDFTKYIESLFSFIALMQMVCNTISICCIGFMMMIAFIFCYSGEYLSNKSTSIHIAAYNSLWYLLKPDDGRIIILLIARSQKKSTITAGNVIDLSLERFTGLMKASASYISILRAMC
ncbi:odorant receptor 13a isoform X2 [Megalopta genalis]|uniref:odorant receptor 13a isoform X2 n=1 Tax=Megalopta genalis TaxID=115081 RepID=UPI003FD47EA4